MVTTIQTYKRPIKIQLKTVVFVTVHSLLSFFNFPLLIFRDEERFQFCLHYLLRVLVFYNNFDICST